MSNATLEDVARLAGVSIKTVSRVVNREPNVRDVTRRKVEGAITRLNYKPNLAARNLASQRSHLICLIYDDPSAYDIPSAGDVIALQLGALRACRQVRHQLLIHPCNYRNKDVHKALTALIETARPVGIVLAAPLSNMPGIIRTISATGTPLVRISPGRTTGRQFSVATNDRAFSADMTRYLASLGHRQIAFIKGSREHAAVTSRFLGYRDGLEQSGIDYSEKLVVSGDNSIGSGENCALKLLEQDNRPTAIFAANDEMAAGVIRVADRLGITIPDALSVAGCDDVALARQVYPALTTIRQPLDDMAERAVLALVEEAAGQATSKGTELFPATLEIRGSTGPAPARNRKPRRQSGQYR